MIQKERANNIVSGEVFKERFTDILQTSLEQVGFSIKSHNQKNYKACRATLWKKLRNGTNRRLPYFTRFFFSLLLSFPQKRAKTKKIFFPWGLQIYNFRHQPLQFKDFVPLRMQALLTNRKFVRRCTTSKDKLNKLDKSFSESKRLLSNDKSLKDKAYPYPPSYPLSYPPSYPSSGGTGTGTGKKGGIGARFHSYASLTKSGKQPPRFTNRRKRVCFTKMALSWSDSKRKHIKTKVLKNRAQVLHECTYGAYKYKSSCVPLRAHTNLREPKQSFALLGHVRAREALYGHRKARMQSAPNEIALTIKIGDYLSSGDRIGEKVLCKKRVLQKSKSLYPIYLTLSPRSLIERVKLGGSHAPYGGIQSDYKFSPFIAYKSCCNTTKPQKISTPIILGSSGRVVTISKTQVIVQKTQPVLFYKSANLHVKKGSWVKQGSPILTLTHQTLITGDIVQGIPRIEQLFEAFTSAPPAFKDKSDFTKFKDGYNTLHSQVRDIFRNNWLKNRLPIAVRKSLEEIGYILVEMIQKVYLSQGVLIADKHIEIIVRQIASKGQILDSGSTGLFLEEVLPIRQIENANLTTPGKKCLYVPAVMGLTAAALNSDSFISAASFQETTRVLSRDAIVGKSDFLRGLKEKVVIGDLISAGTGLDLYFIYTTMLTT